MVAFKDNKAMRSDVTTRKAKLMTDISFLLRLSVFGRLLAGTNNAGKRSLGLVLRSRAVWLGNDCEDSTT